MKNIISVVIPTYNRQAFTERAIESVICKQAENIEIVVIDDCGSQPFVYSSSINSHGIRVRVIRANKNSGPGVARSIGVSQARGELIAFLDSDDIFESSWLDAVLYETRKLNSKSAEEIFMVGNVVGASLIVRSVDKILRVIPDSLKLFFVRGILMVSNSFHTPSIAVSRNACVFSDRMRYCEDYYTNAMTIFRVVKFSRLNVTSCVLARSQGTEGGVSEAKWKMFQGEMQVRRMLLHSRKIPLLYRLLIPFGMFYQVIRGAVIAVIRRH